MSTELNIILIFILIGYYIYKHYFKNEKNEESDETIHNYNSWMNHYNLMITAGQNFSNFKELKQEFDNWATIHFSPSWLEGEVPEFLQLETDLQSENPLELKRVIELLATKIEAKKLSTELEIYKQSNKILKAYDLIDNNELKEETDRIIRENILSSEWLGNAKLVEGITSHYGNDLNKTLAALESKII